MTHRRSLTRRSLLLALGASAVACRRSEAPGTRSPSPVDPSGSATAVAGPTFPPAPTTETPAHPSLPEAVEWRPLEAEVEPQVKMLAARAVEALGTVPGAEPSPSERLSAAGLPAELAATAGPLVPPGTPAVTTVTYPQYGGLTSDAASVMLVAEQTWVDGAGLKSRTVTVDLRLERGDGRWQLVELRPAEAVALPPDPPPAAAALLARPRVDVPDAAAADLASDVADTDLAGGLDALAESFGFAVSVVTSGHPHHVFGTDRVSNHTRGRAADIWAIDGVPVIALHDDPRLAAFIERAGELGASEIGGPYDPDGPGGRHFTDRVHQDHVHLAFTR